MNKLHLRTMAGGHTFAKNHKGISKTYMSKEWHARIS